MLQKLFLPMEHLPVHLPYEARIAGPVQYRWMYPFERYLRKLKLNVKNKARVEGSIANAFLMDEASMFCSYYFEEHVRTKARSVPRNDDECANEDKHEGEIYTEHVKRNEPAITDSQLSGKVENEFLEWFKQY
ncbi:hypothetical protein OROMI_031401 [Orobanche minor]